MKNEILSWHDWIDESEVPINEPLLVEVQRVTLAKPEKQYRIAFFKQAREKGPIIGRVGDLFSFDRKILRWASLKDILEGDK